MSFVSRVNQKSPVKNKASEHNRFADVANTFGKTGVSGAHGVVSRTNSTVSIYVKNMGDIRLEAGLFVTFVNTDASMNANAGCILFNKTSAPYGLLMQSLNPGEIGECAIGGIVELNTSVGVPIQPEIYEYINPITTTSAFLSRGTVVYSSDSVSINRIAQVSAMLQQTTGSVVQNRKYTVTLSSSNAIIGEYAPKIVNEEPDTFKFPSSKYDLKQKIIDAMAGVFKYQIFGKAGKDGRGQIKSCKHPLPDKYIDWENDPRIICWNGRYYHFPTRYDLTKQVEMQIDNVWEHHNDLSNIVGFPYSFTRSKGLLYTIVQHFARIRNAINDLDGMDIGEFDVTLGFDESSSSSVDEFSSSSDWYGEPYIPEYTLTPDYESSESESSSSSSSSSSEDLYVTGYSIEIKGKKYPLYLNGVTYVFAQCKMSMKWQSESDVDFEIVVSNHRPSLVQGQIYCMICSVSNMSITEYFPFSQSYMNEVYSSNGGALLNALNDLTPNT